MSGKSDERIRGLVLSGIFAAMIFVVTAYFPRIPTARGYVHVGDAVIYIAASMLPQPAAALSAAIGGFLADALTGYVVWAPYTAVIKALLTLAFTSRRETILAARNVAAAVAAFAVTIGGYYLAGWAVAGDWRAPLAEVPFNALQAAGSLVIYVAAAGCMDRAGVKKIIGRA